MSFIILINIILISRLFFLPRNRAIDIWSTLAAVIVQIAGIAALYEYVPYMLLLAALVISFNLTSYFLESRFQDSARIDNLPLLRFSSLFLYILLLSFALNPHAIRSLDNRFSDVFMQVINYSTIRDLGFKLNLQVLNIGILGMLLNWKEGNIIVRSVLRAAKIGEVPGTSGNILYGAGRIIGVMERSLIFFFALSGNYTAIGFTLGAKGLIRIKEIQSDEGNFQEYFLVGTLSSIALAMITALMVKFLLY